MAEMMNAHQTRLRSGGSRTSFWVVEKGFDFSFQNIIKLHLYGQSEVPSDKTSYYTVFD